MKRFIVETSGEALRTFLKESLGASAPSVKQIKRLIDLGQCTVDGKVEKFSSLKLKKGQKVEISLDQVSKPLKPLFDPGRILYENDHYLIYNKPCHLTCAPGEIHAFFPEKLYIVHRLDKATSGALLLAKTLQAKEKAEDLFRERAVDKTYIAIVKGSIKTSQKADSGKIISHLIQIASFDGQRLYGSLEKQKGKKPSDTKSKYAETHWEVLKEERDATWIRCVLKTGRTHQIRVHLSELGHPILGDSLYGRNAGCAKRLYLHAESLKFIDPFTQKEIYAEASLPPEFSKV